MESPCGNPLGTLLACSTLSEGELPLSVTQQQQLQVWEAFLNGPSAKERLMSRYLYEHMFLDHLYFEAGTSHRSFRIVRSSVIIVRTRTDQG